MVVGEGGAFAAGDGAATCCVAGATQLILSFGTSVHIAADGSVVNAGIAAAPAVNGSLSVSVVVRTDMLSGHEARYRTLLEYSQNGGPQVGEPGPKTTSVQETAAAMNRLDVVRLVLVTWLGHSG